jgi:DNA-binding transcriptional LysR family regulator
MGYKQKVHNQGSEHKDIAMPVSHHDSRTDLRPGARPVHLPSLIGFESVARHLNFARAAAELGVTPTAISRSIRQLEAQLGVRLFNRTTRSVSLTESGAQLHDSFAPALEQIRRSVQAVGITAGEPYGRLRINTSYVAYAVLIEPHLPAFLARYPDISVELTMDNSLADIVAGGYDAGIRLGEALQRDMIALPLGPMRRMVVVGSPAYLAARGEPQRPEDLLAHECIGQRLSSRGRLMDWEFRIRQKWVTTDVQGRLVFDEMRAVLGAALRGCGLAYVFEAFAAEELAAGHLRNVLDRWLPADEAFHLYYPSKLMMPGKLRAFIEFFRAANEKPR